MNKFQKELAKLKEKGNFYDKTCYKVYPTNSIPPQLYYVIKAHKPEKHFVMRTTVFTTEIAPYTPYIIYIYYIYYI